MTSSNDQIAKLAKARLKITLSLSAIMIVLYFGFMGLFAFNKPLLGTIITPGLSLCILFGAAVIVLSFLLCAFYVVWANKVYDPAVKLLSRVGES